MVLFIRSASVTLSRCFHCIGAPLTFAQILTARLLLRGVSLNDGAAMFAYRSDPKVARYQSWSPQNLLEVQKFITNISTAQFGSVGWYQIGIALQTDGSMIGDCGIRILDDDPRISEIGITIAPHAQAQGYATEALNAVLEMLFVNLDKHRVFASVDPQNLPSIALMKKIGMRKEGHFFQSLWLYDNWVDEVVFAMLASEWRSKT